MVALIYSDKGHDQLRNSNHTNGIYFIPNVASRIITPNIKFHKCRKHNIISTVEN